MHRVTLFIVTFFIALQAFAQDNSRELFKFAKFKFDNGEYAAALDYLNQTINSDASYSNAYLLRAEIYYNDQKYSQAVDDLSKAFAIDTAYSSFLNKYYIIKAKSHAQLNEIESAEAIYKKLLTRDNYNSENHYQYAQFKFSINEAGEAIRLINDAIKIDPALGKLYAIRAFFTQKAYTVFPGDEVYQRINDDYNLAVYLDPDNYEFYKLRSEFKRQMGQEIEALTDYNKMIELSPNNEYAYTERGVLKMHKENYLDAVEDFSASIELFPKDAKNFRYRGLCLHNMRQYYDAYHDFSKSIDLLNAELEESESESVKKVLAGTYLMRGHTLFAMRKSSEACVDFLKALDLGERKGLNYFRKYCQF